MTKEENLQYFLNTLYKTIQSRKGGNIDESYTALLFEKGVQQITKKIGEESTEVIIAALSETPERVISESADLLFHLLVLWANHNITPNSVFKELENRTEASGLEEKSLR
jgi:phosphoribosyl-ATP pyrophosphohydrolase|tara:strand:+ start:822 stop:1151 length:330 start_codon:yes stop_codon:yes gene_type:complete